MSESHDAPFRHSSDGVRSGKVRDIYRFGDYLLLEASDRISVFDVVLPTAVPDKGRVLTYLSAFWFDRLCVSHHMVTTLLKEMQASDGRIQFGGATAWCDGRCMLVRRAEVVPIECVVRGYLTGSGWAAYKKEQAVCGIELPAGLVESAKLPEPIFTPATKAETGHDENISFERMVQIIGDQGLAETLRRLSIALYTAGAAHALERGIIIADTKFEFGLIDGSPVLIDEVLTPDSSRFWPADRYETGRSQPSYDKQFVRDYCADPARRWNKEPPGPELPIEIVEKTRAQYIEAYEKLTGQFFPWKLA